MLLWWYFWRLDMDILTYIMATIQSREICDQSGSIWPKGIAAKGKYCTICIFMVLYKDIKARRIKLSKTPQSKRGYRGSEGLTQRDGVCLMVIVERRLRGSKWPLGRVSLCVGWGLAWGIRAGSCARVSTSGVWGDSGLGACSGGGGSRVCNSAPFAH